MKLHATLLFALPLLASRTEGLQTTGAYDEIDNVEGSFVHFNYAPIEGIVLDHPYVYAVNTHDSTVQRFSDLTGQPSMTYRVPWGPVSVAIWHDPNAGDASRLLVVSRGSKALTMIDPASGTVLAVLPIETPTGERLSEPGDILVDEDDDLAWISCSANQAVLEVDLVARAASNVYRLNGVHPLYLSRDADDNLLVAPMLSGNASGAHKADPRSIGELGILDLDPLNTALIDPAVPNNGLPDTDLFRIDLSRGGKVDTLARAMGAVCFDHATNPVTGDVWLLNTGARNKELEGEEAHRGVFARNQVSIVTAPASSAGAVVPERPHTIVDLDLVAATGSTPDPAFTVGQPMSFAFDALGNAYIAGTTTDNILVVDKDGDFVGEWDLPEGAIPRFLLYDAFFDSVFVLLWGTNEVRAYWVGDVGGSPWGVFDLGYDPTPAEAARGRETFYNAALSLHNNLTCGTCHVDGRSDNLLWDLGSEQDPKGALLTQTLAGIERVAPFHWRGERAGLVDFNPAFKGLMGATHALNAQDFSDFRDFVFSISNAPNFTQNRERLLDRSIQPKLVPNGMGALPVADAVAGRDEFDGCAICHSLPLGTKSDFSKDGELSPKRTDRKVGPFHDILRRDFDANVDTPGYQFVQITWNPTYPDPPPFSDYALTGAATSSRGTVPGINRFVKLFGFPEPTTANITAFISQLDQGLAPATQEAFLVDENASAATIASVEEFLIPQARDVYVTETGQEIHNCDVVVFGKVLVDETVRELAWFYDPEASPTTPFQCEDSDVPDVDLDFFLDLAAEGDASVVFLGVPHGMGRRFGIDYDGDGLANLDEADESTSPYDPDSDDDGLPDGYSIESTPPEILDGSLQVLWSTARVARLRFETDEPTTALVSYDNGAGHSGSVSSNGLARLHSFLLTDLLPSAAGQPNVYEVTVVATDPSDNDTTEETSIQTEGPTARGGVRLALFEVTNAQYDWPPPGATIHLRARVVDRNIAADDVGLPGYKVIAKVYRNGDSSVPIDTGSTPQTFTVDPTPLNMVNDVEPYVGELADSAAPFLISGVTDASGYVDFSVYVPNGRTSNDLEVVIESVAQPDSTGFHFPDIREWSLPSTAPQYRKVKVEPGTYGGQNP